MLHLYYQRRCWTATTHWPPRLHSWHCHCYAGTLHNKGDVNLPDSSVDLNSYHIRKQHPRASGIAPESPSCDDGALLLSYGVSLVHFKVFVWLTHLRAKEISAYWPLSFTWPWRLPSSTAMQGRHDRNHDWVTPIRKPSFTSPIYSSVYSSRVYKLTCPASATLVITTA